MVVQKSFIEQSVLYSQTAKSTFSDYPSTHTFLHLGVKNLRATTGRWSANLLGDASHTANFVARIVTGVTTTGRRIADLLGNMTTTTNLERRVVIFLATKSCELKSHVENWTGFGKGY